MSIFCGKACKCTQKAKGFFPGQPDLQKGFRNACIANESLSKQDYMCGGKYVDERVVMLAYGYDPCAGGASIPDILDPTKSAEREDANIRQLTPLFIVLGVAVVIGLVAFIILSKRK